MRNRIEMANPVVKISVPATEKTFSGSYWV